MQGTLYSARHFGSAARVKHRFFQRLMAAIILMAFVVLPFTACGASSTQAKSPTNSNEIVFNGDGLHTEASLRCDENIVLATNRITYDTGEIQAMNAYLKGIAIGTYSNSFGNVHVVGTSAGGERPADPPGSLALVDGGSDCGAQIELTNTSSSPIVITQIGAKLLAAPTVNTYQYRWVDCYSLVPEGAQGYGRGCTVFDGTGSPQCDTYSASIDLKNGAVGTVFSATPSAMSLPGGEDCPAQLTIEPHSSTMFLDVDFTGGNLKYPVAIQLKIRAAEGEKTLTLSKSPTTLTFAGAAQFSCYTLEGTTFTFVKHAIDTDVYQCV
jgi:hypothetical protein